jgi:hypothetical protein
MDCLLYDAIPATFLFDASVAKMLLVAEPRAVSEICLVCCWTRCTVQEYTYIYLIAPGYLVSFFGKTFLAVRVGK